MRLLVGKRPIKLPPRPCVPEDALRLVNNANPPFVVHTPYGGRFKTTRRVFLEAEDARAECESGSDLWFACRLWTDAHNALHELADPETERMEAEAQARMAEPDSEDELQPKEEEDISLEEWKQLGYNWFAKEDVVYI